VTHHVEEIIPEIGQVLLLKHGRTLREGDKAAVLTDSALGEAFGMPVRVTRHGEWYEAAVQ
jgi:iron complex transport system ATP-binding protein